MAGHLTVDEILATLTIEQKTTLLSGWDSWHTQPIHEAGIPAIWLSDGPHGVRREIAALHSLPATCFPTESALGATWDRDLTYRVAQALGAESATLGVSVLLGPGINIKRTPLCGRNFEYLSEDPLLTGELATFYVRGVQSQGVGTSLKHFAANNQEWGRHWYSSDVDDRTLREIYLAAFERVITQANPWTVMCSYNRLNGVHTSQHRWLLNDILRTEWGYTGVVVSDWGAVHDRVAALRAGLDLEMPGGDGHTDAKVAAAIAAGELSEDTLNQSVRRIVELVSRAYPARDDRIIRWGEVEGTPGAEGQLQDSSPAATATEAPSFDGEAQLDDATIAAHHALAREAATSAMTLLRNTGVLPITDRHAKIAVIGQLAQTPRIQGAGSALVNPTRSPVSLVDAMRAFAEVTYTPGYRLTTDEGDPQLHAEACAAVQEAELAIVVVGQSDGTESEGYDRATIDLPAGQIELLTGCIATGTPVIVVVSSGSAILLGDWHDAAVAILHSPYAGQASGEALADIVFGVANPSGKLAETWPLRLEDTSAYATYPGDRGHTRYGEGVLVGYRWYDALRLGVRYPFGHGLSYTSFNYSTPAAQLDTTTQTVSVSCTVTNTGSMPGAEVVQVYVAPPARPSGVILVDGEPTDIVPFTPVRRAVRELRAFTKVNLAPGESTDVSWELTGRDFAYWDTADQLWRQDAGTYRIEFAASSRDVRAHAEVTLAAAPTALPEATDTELHARVVARSAECEPPVG